MPRLEPPEHIPNNTRTTLPPGNTLFLGAGMALVCGLFILAIGLDIIGADEDISVPRWIIGWFGGAFIVAGLIIAIPAWLRTRPIPNGPAWRRDHNWDSRGIGDDSGRRLRAHFLSLLGIGLFLLPFHAIWQLQDATQYKSWFDYAALVWPLMIYGFELILFTSFLHLLWKLFARLRHGRSWLEFANFPYHLGRPMEATLRVTRKLADQPVELELRCVQDRVVKRGSGDNERQEVQAFALYSDTQMVQLDSRASARIELTLPRELPATNLREAPAHFWELVVRAERNGPDFQSVFLLPVYA